MNFHRIKQVVQTEHTLQDHEWKGAVVFLCNKDHVFFIKRSEKMPTHGGQMAFVGGHKKEGELDPWETAQREYEEETYHARDSIRLIGFLPLVITSRLVPIVPVLTELVIPTEKFMEEVKSNGEWDTIIAYSWKELLKEENWEFGWYKGLSEHPILFHPLRSGHYMPRENQETQMLWGATASIVWNLLQKYSAI